MKGLTLTKILLAASAVVGGAIASPKATYIWNHRNDGIHLAGNVMDLRRSEKIIAREGQTIEFGIGACDYDGLKRQRFFINDVLYIDREIHPFSSGDQPGSFGGVMYLKTTEEGFKPGYNLLKFEVEDCQGDVQTTYVEVDLTPKGQIFIR